MLFRRPRAIAFGLFFAFSSLLQAQAGAVNLDPAITVGFGYGPFFSAGDLGERFGNGFALDGAVSFLPANSGWEFGLMAQYGFGTEVKEDVLAGIRTREGLIIGNQREPADIQLRQRQLFVGPRAGYTLRVGKNQRAGIKLATGLGYFYSRIRIQKDAVQFVPQIDKSLQGGYDRLAGGPALYQFVGYQQLALDRRLNFYAGAELMVGITNNLRAFDFATNAPPPQEGRTDALLGFKVGLILPFYTGDGREIFY